MSSSWGKIYHLDRSLWSTHTKNTFFQSARHKHTMRRCLALHLVCCRVVCCFHCQVFPTYCQFSLRISKDKREHYFKKSTYWINYLYSSCCWHTVKCLKYRIETHINQKLNFRFRYVVPFLALNRMTQLYKIRVVDISKVSEISTLISIKNFRFKYVVHFRALNRMTQL